MSNRVEENPMMAMIWGMAATLEFLDLEEYHARMITLETTGQFLDPTLWRKKRKQFYEDKKIIETALAMKKVFLEIQAEHKGD